VILERNETRLARNEKRLERNETRLARNETRGGNLLLSGTVGTCYLHKRMDRRIIAITSQSDKSGERGMLSCLLFYLDQLPTVCFHVRDLLCLYSLVFLNVLVCMPHMFQLRSFLLA